MMTYTDPDKPIEVSLNQTFTISLESNPTTGYIWEEEYDSEFIKLVEKGKFIPHSESVGSGGEEPFDFRAKKVGETQITMKKKRKWETVLKEVKVFKVYISQ